MADPLMGARLPTLELVPDGEPVCPECDDVVVGVDVPLAIDATAGPTAQNQITVFVRAGAPRLRPCGHALRLTGCTGDG